MAGLGFKDFAVGEVLTAADVDGYLMQQSVMRFADSAARGSALGTAAGTGVALAEGMVSYLDDVNQVQVYDGTLWKPTGTILQVVQAVKTDTFTTTSATFADITGLSATITPTASTNKILIMAQVDWNPGSGGGHLRLTGGNAETYVGDAASSRVRTAVTSGENDANAANSATIVYLDSPAVTTAVTYKVQARRGTGGTVYVNRTSNDLDTAVYGRSASSITLFEVSA